MAGIRQIAERANVSIGTVDRVLHNRGGVAESTVRRVREVMRELDYTPDIHASSMSSKRVYRFGALIPEFTQDSGFWRGPAAGVHSAATDLQRFRVQVSVYNYDEWDASSFLTQVDKSLDDGVRGLLIAPATMTGHADVFRHIPRDIPYVICDSYLPGTACLSYVGENSLQAGRTAGRLMSDTVHPGTVVAFRTLPGTTHIDRRVKGFVELVDSRDDLRCVTVDLDCNVGDSEMDRSVRSVFDKYPDVSGVFISNGELHRIADSVQRYRRTDLVRLIGYDLIPANRALLERGEIDYIVAQRPEEQAYLGIQLLYRHDVLQQPCPREVILPIDIVCTESVRQYSAIFTTSAAIESALRDDASDESNGNGLAD